MAATTLQQAASGGISFAVPTLCRAISILLPIAFAHPRTPTYTAAYERSLTATSPLAATPLAASSLAASSLASRTFASSSLTIRATGWSCWLW